MTIGIDFRKADKKTIDEALEQLNKEEVSSITLTNVISASFAEMYVIKKTISRVWDWDDWMGTLIYNNTEFEVHAHMWDGNILILRKAEQ